MRRLGAVAASLLLVGTVLLAAPASAGNDLDDFDLILDFTGIDEDDHGKKGPSDGDEIDFKADLLDGDDDEGRAYGDCELDDVKDDDDYSVDCKITFKLDDGTIKAKGTADDDDLDDGRMELEIYEGTDDYKKADGEVKLEMLHHDKKSHPMFRDHKDHDWHHHKLEVKFRFDE